MALSYHSFTLLGQRYVSNHVCKTTQSCYMLYQVTVTQAKLIFKYGLLRYMQALFAKYDLGWGGEYEVRYTFKSKKKKLKLTFLNLLSFP